jgi:hypothetical protein
MNDGAAVDDDDDDDDDDDHPRYLPSPEEIAAACLVIQAGWSVDEHRSRRVIRPSKVAPTDGVVAAAEMELDFALAKRRAARAG